MLVHIDEAFDPAMLTDLGAERHGQGLEDPKSRGRGQISGENVRCWARDFTPDQVERLHSELGALAERLGYRELGRMGDHSK